MLGKKNHSAVLAKYYNMYKKNPRSKVFAPLAESYRKLGMLDEAFKILKDGIRNHPTYTLGYIVLANCYFDQEKYELTYNTLRPIISQNADNVSLQKIFAQACIHLGYLEEALDTYKYLLFMNPREKTFADEVKRLEDDLMVGHKKLSLDQLIKTPEFEKLPVSQAVDDDWVQVNFGEQAAEHEPISTIKAIQDDSDSDDDWVMARPGTELKNKEPEPVYKEEEIQFVVNTPEPVAEKPQDLESHPLLHHETILKRDLDDDFYADEFEEFGDIEEVNDEEVENDAPIVSHTLIDLYCSQKYFDKAIELLQKILELNPNDEASSRKLDHVRELRLASLNENHHEDIPTEQEGHDELISIIENQVKTKSPQEVKLQETFDLFLKALKTEAQAHR